VNTVRFHSRIIAAIGSMLFCSCATAPHDSAVIPSSELPADVDMNKEAGRGMMLFVKVHLVSGEEFPCAVDTGSPTSLFPKSLEPKLGKRLGTRRFSTLDSSNGETEHLYAAPKLYLGNTPLVIGSRIGTWDSSMGVLGMDCLRHYCIQLDFEAGKLCFLDPEHANGAELGNGFPLTLRRYVYINHGGLIGDQSSKTLIDTGCFFDGLVNPGLFDREFQKQKAGLVPLLKEGGAKGMAAGFACFPECVWNGDTYTELVIQKGETFIGLRFLARHLVTFNFPKKIMYLKRTRSGPLSYERSP
jgi:hypothetical protein